MGHDEARYNPLCRPRDSSHGQFAGGAGGAGGAASGANSGGGSGGDSDSDSDSDSSGSDVDIAAEAKRGRIARLRHAREVRVDIARQQATLEAEPARQCSPRHKMPLNSRNEGS